MVWIKLKANQYQFREQNHHFSTAQIEIDVSYKDVQPLPLTGDYSFIAPLRVLSFDIECSAKKGFP